jgi:PTH1 family peptidyl-tRNA hydrolase
MANFNAAGSQPRSEGQSLAVELPDQASNDLHDHSVEDTHSDSAELTPIREPNSPKHQRKHFKIKRRPIHVPTNTGAVNEDETSLSPIIPSPLRIRKTKPSLQVTVPGAMKQVRLLIASLGNPSPYHTTRHSAGHIIVKNLVQSLRFPALTKNKALGNGLVSSGAEAGRSEYTLWQSTSMMNDSGAGVMKAWKQFSAFHNDIDTVTGLVVLHDELESNLGAVKLRRGESSPKGHNGIKSVQSSLKSAGLLNAMSDRFIKIGIGIGRPVSRERDEVSAWVLGQVTQIERLKLEAAAESVLATIQSEIANLENS